MATSLSGRPSNSLALSRPLPITSSCPRCLPVSQPQLSRWVGISCMAFVSSMPKNGKNSRQPDIYVSRTLSRPRTSLFDSRFIAGISASICHGSAWQSGSRSHVVSGFSGSGRTGGLIDKANLFQRIFWVIEGFLMVLVAKMHLPYGFGDWYWNSSRVLPDSSGSPITEFPLFTFIYSDLHAHMIALMITILAIAWALPCSCQSQVEESP